MDKQWKYYSMYSNPPPHQTNLGKHIHIRTSQQLQQIKCKYHWLTAFQCTPMNVASCKEQKCVFLKATPFGLLTFRHHAYSI